MALFSHHGDIFPEDGLEVGVFIREEMKYKKFLNLLLLDP